MSSKVKAQGLFDSKIIASASIDALRKLDPRALAKNSVIFVTEVVSLMVTLLFIRNLVTHNGTASFLGQIAFPPAVQRKILKQDRAASMPDAVWTVSRHRPD